MSLFPPFYLLIHLFKDFIYMRENEREMAQEEGGSEREKQNPPEQRAQCRT